MFMVVVWEYYDLPWKTGRRKILQIPIVGTQTQSLNPG